MLIIKHINNIITDIMRAAWYKSSGLDNLVYYDYDDEYNYYFFVLGHVNSVPLAYRPAVYYNGITNITIGYSSSNVTQESISSSVTEASIHSVANSNTATWNNEAGGTIKTEAKFGIPLIGQGKASLEASYKHSWGGSESTSVTTSRSFSNTYETSRSTASETIDALTVTIGEKGEPAGLYRYSLFTTVDVYFVLITNRAKTDFVEANTIFCARPTQYWELDYEPERGGSFGKTASGALLQIPEIDISQLPDIEACDHQWGPWIITTVATPATDGEKTSTCSLCQRIQTETIPATGIEHTLKIAFNEYKISATTSKDYFKHGVYQMGIEIGVVGGELFAKHPENGDYHNYGTYDDNLKNNKTVVRTYPIAANDAIVKVPKNSSFYIRFKTHTEVERYWWVIVAIFGGREYSTGEQTVFFDYNSVNEDWEPRNSIYKSSVTFNSNTTTNFNITHTMNYSITKE